MTDHSANPRAFAVGGDDQRTVEARLVDDMLHGGQELHVFAVDRVAEKAVDLRAAAFAAAVHDAQRIEFHAAAFEHPHGLHDARESRLAAFGKAESVVNVFGTVKRDAHQKIVRREQVAPRLVNQRAVGLKGVLDAFAVGVFPLELHGPAVEIDAQQQRFAAVPAELDRIDFVGADVLFDVKFQQFVAHHGLPAAVLHRLVEVIAVVAIEVAGRAGRLEHRREGNGAGLFLGVAESEDVFRFHR